MSSLYNISENILQIFNEVEELEGEITDELYEELCDNQEALNKKLTNYVKAIKEFDKDVAFCKDEKKRINDRQSVYKNRIERLKDAIIKAVNTFGEQGKTNKFIELPTFRISTKRNKEVVIDEERVNLLIYYVKQYLEEVISYGVYDVEEIDLEGVLVFVNNLAKAEHPGITPFVVKDLSIVQIEISRVYTLEELILNDTNNTTNIILNDNKYLSVPYYDKTDYKKYIDIENTVVSGKENLSLIIK